MDKRFILDAGFYCNSANNSANVSTKVLRRNGHNIVSISNNASFDNMHSDIRKRHVRGASLDFEPLGKIHNVNKLYNEFQTMITTNARFNHKRKKGQMLDRLNLKGMEDHLPLFPKSAADRVKILIKNTKKEPLNPQLKQDIAESLVRKNVARAGNLNDMNYFNESKISKETKPDDQIERIMTSQQRYTPPELKSIREYKLDEKLGYFDESPRTMQRRLETEHLPWEKQPDVPPDPDAEVWTENLKRQKVHQHRERFSTIVRQIDIGHQKKLSTILKPEFLGQKGMDLLVTIMKDSELSVSPTKKDIELLKQDANTNRKLVRKQTKKHKSKTTLMRKLAEDSRSKNVKASGLVAEYFQTVDNPVST